MLPGLGIKFSDKIEVISKPRHEFQTPEYAALGLPKAPAIMVADEVVVVGRDIGEEDLLAAIERHRQVKRSGES